MQHMKVSLHSTATGTLVLPLVTHSELPNTDVCLYRCSTDCTHTQSQPRDILAVLPAHEQHFPPPLKVPAQSPPPSLPADRACWAALMEWDPPVGPFCCACSTRGSPTEPAPTSTSCSGGSLEAEEEFPRSQLSRMYPFPF